MKPNIQIAAAAALFVSLAGCTVPVSTLLEKKKTQTRVASRVPSPPGSASAPRGAQGPAYELRVNDETVTAQELWAGEHEKLTQVRAQGREPYQQFLDT